MSATASYCMHCDADLDGTDDEAVESAVIEFDAESVTTEEATGEPPGGTVEERGAERRSGSGETAPDPRTAREDAGADDRGWLHPDSLLDDVSTGAVGIVAGLIVGFLAMVLALLATGSALAFLVGPVGWVGAGLYVGWTRSVFRAVRKACYLIAPTLAALPLFWFGDAPQGGDVGGRIVAFVLSEAVVLPVALVLVGVGYWIGGKAPD